MLYFFLGLIPLFIFIFLIGFFGSMYTPGEPFCTASIVITVLIIVAEIIIFIYAGSCYLEEPLASEYTYVEFDGTELKVSENPSAYMYCELKRRSAWDFKKDAVSEYWLKKDGKLVFYTEDFNKVKDYFVPTKPGTVIFKVEGD